MVLGLTAVSVLSGALVGPSLALSGNDLSRAKDYLRDTQTYSPRECDRLISSLNTVMEQGSEDELIEFVIGEKGVFREPIWGKVVNGYTGTYDIRHNLFEQCIRPRIYTSREARVITSNLFDYLYDKRFYRKPGNEYSYFFGLVLNAEQYIAGHHITEKSSRLNEIIEALFTNGDVKIELTR